MPHFTKSGERLYTADQIQNYFTASFWAEYDQKSQDDPDTNAGALFGGHAAFYLGDTRISCGAGLVHRDAEYLTKKAKEKGKTLDQVYAYTGGAPQTVRQKAKELIEAESRIAALQARLDILESIDSGSVGDSSNSHDQAFDNKEVVA